MENAKSELKKGFMDISNFSAQAIVISFALMAAMAWHEAVKNVMQKYVTVPGKGVKHHIYYALIVTGIAIVAFKLVHDWFKKNVSETAKEFGF